MTNKTIKTLIFSLVVMLSIIIGVFIYQMLVKNQEDSIYSPAEQQQLYNEFLNGNINTYNNYLNDGSRLNFTFEDGRTPLEVLIQINDVWGAKKIIDSGFDITKIDGNKSQIVKNVMEMNRYQSFFEIDDVIVLLISQVKDIINEPDESGYSLLMNAIYYNNPKAISEILKYIDDVNLEYKNRTALSFATYYYDVPIETIKLIVDSGADLNVQDEKGWTALMNIVSLNDPEKLSYFLSLPGVLVNLKNNNGSTALNLAASYDNAYAIEQLLKVPGIIK
jgi:ankyrin repeat protein